MSLPPPFPGHSFNMESQTGSDKSGCRHCQGQRKALRGYSGCYSGYSVTEDDTGRGSHLLWDPVKYIRHTAIQASWCLTECTVTSEFTGDESQLRICRAFRDCGGPLLWIHSEPLQILIQADEGGR